MENKIFAVQLTTLMKKSKVTTVKLSEATGIAEITINKLRSGRNINPTLSTVKQLADYFKISVDELITENIQHIDVLDIENINKKLPHILIKEFLKDINLAVKITNNNYTEFKKDSILLLSSEIIPKNEDIILIQIKDSLVLSKLVIEGINYIGASLIIKDKYYQINLEDKILGVVMGVIWRKN